MTAPHTPQNHHAYDLVVYETTHSIRWKGLHCHLGNSMIFRCLKVLAAAPNQAIRHDEMLEALGHCLRNHPNDVRLIIYRLKTRLRTAGMPDLADRIDNVRKAYVLQL